MNLEELNGLPAAQARSQFENCCAAEKWIEGMLAGRPYRNSESLIAQSRSLWDSLTEPDWLQAFEAHPQIGNVETLRQKYAGTKALASGEQSGTSLASDDVLQRLKAANDLYLKRHGFIFIVCATGKSAEEMLALLEARLGNSREQELKNAACEQAKITELRLEKLV